VPVTAKLSKKFYDTLGEDLATELVDWFNQVNSTYRSDLREKRIGSLKADLIKWMFLLWVGTVGTVLTVMRMTAA